MKNAITDSNVSAVINYTGDIEPVPVSVTIAAMKVLESAGVRSLLMTLDSLGGSVEDAKRLYRAMRFSRLQIVTHNVGTVESAANIVFMGGNIRRANSESRFMLHSAMQSYPILAQNGQVAFTASQLLEGLKSIMQANIDTSRVVCAHTKLKARQMDQMLSSDEGVRFGPLRAKSYGMIHSIGSFSTPANAATLNIDGDALLSSSK